MHQSPVRESPVAPAARSIPGTINLLLVGVLALLALWAFAWPVYRAVLRVEIATNEGWNAFYADAAMGRMPLYPAPDRLITNNYPPLSFYVIGFAAKLFGDPVFVGRFLSLASVLALAGAVFGIARAFGANLLGSAIGALFFLATLSRFCVDYVGMNDPQLFSQAIMAAALLWFLIAEERGRSPLPAILLMVVAGFVKHNIVAMPFAACIYLFARRPRQALVCFGAAALLVAIGFLFCSVAYGGSFWANFFAARTYSLKRAVKALGDARCLSIPLIAAAGVIFWKRAERRLALLAIWLAISFGVFFLQKTGAGVDINAMFDLVISSAVGVGVAWSALAERRREPKLAAIAWLAPLLVLALDVRLIPFKRRDSLEAWRMIFDRGFRKEIAAREAAMAQSIEWLRETPGDVVSDTLALYWSGKPFVLDEFNTAERIARGALPDDAVRSRLKSGAIRRVETEPMAEWENEPY